MSHFKTRPLHDQSLYQNLGSEVPSGQFRFYKTQEVPNWIEKHGNYAHCCVLITATTVSDNFSLGSFNPNGQIFTISYFRDDIDYTHGQHFNKDSRAIFLNNDGTSYNLSFKDNQHLIQTFAAGTSQPYLISTFNLPQKNFGSISELSPCHETLRFHNPQ